MNALLAARFGPLSHEVNARIASSNVEELQSWLSRTHTVSSAEELVS